MKTIAVFAIVGLTVVTPVTYGQDSPSPPAPEHRPQQLQIWDGFWHARINYRYHTLEGNRWGWWDRASRLGVCVLALLSICGPYLYEKRKLWKGLWYTVGVASFLLTLAVFIYPFPEWTGDDTVFAGRWNQLANEWYELYEKAPNMDPDALEQGIASLKKSSVDIEAAEKTSRYDESVMEAAEKAERVYQGFSDKDAPISKSQTKRLPRISFNQDALMR